MQLISACEATYGPISDCEGKLLSFSSGTTLVGAISATISKKSHPMLQ